MPQVPGNLVHETSTSTGTGNFTTSAFNGNQRFSDQFGTGATTNVFDYFISNQAAAEWERGTGHMSAVGTLVRDTVLQSSNSNALVSFSAGTKDVINDRPAAQQARVADYQSFTSSGTWTKPSGFNANAIAKIQGWGAGGGSARGAAATAGAGAGGAYFELWIPLSSLGATETVTIGAAGVGRTGSNGDGTAGGNSTFGAWLTAYGGGPGLQGGGGGCGGGMDGAGQIAPLPYTADGVSFFWPKIILNPWNGGWGASVTGNYSSNWVVPLGSLATNPGAAFSALNAVWAGGGGGAPGLLTGGSSQFGGKGGNGSATTTATAGSTPAGGGGSNGTSGTNGTNGGGGQIIVTVFDGG